MGRKSQRPRQQCLLNESHLDVICRSAWGISVGQTAAEENLQRNDTGPERSKSPYHLLSFEASTRWSSIEPNSRE